MTIKGTSIVLIGVLTNPLFKLYFEELNSCAITIYNITFYSYCNLLHICELYFYKNIS